MFYDNAMRSSTRAVFLFRETPAKLQLQWIQVRFLTSQHHRANFCTGKQTITTTTKCAEEQDSAQRVERGKSSVSQICGESLRFILVLEHASRFLAGLTRDSKVCPISRTWQTGIEAHRLDTRAKISPGKVSCMNTGCAPVFSGSPRREVSLTN